MSNNAWGLGIYGNHPAIPPDLQNAILVTDNTLGRLYRLSDTENRVASFTLPAAGYLTGVAAVSDSTTTIMVSSDSDSPPHPSVARYAWDNSLATYTLIGSAGIGLRVSGGTVAGGRYWHFSGGFGNGYIRSWPVTGDLDDGASQTLAVGGAPCC